MPEQHEMPEVPGLVIEDSRRRGAQGIAECIIAEQCACRPDVIVGPELHELTEQALRLEERLGG